MSAQRIKGQEVSIIIVRGGVYEDSLTDVTDFDGTVMLEVKSQGMLGETTERKDELFKGIKFSLGLQLHNQLWFNVEKAIIDRARRRTPDLIFNISGVFSFPNGDTVTKTVLDAKFGEIPLSVSNRGDYVKVKLQGEAEDWATILS